MLSSSDLYMVHFFVLTNDFSKKALTNNLGKLEMAITDRYLQGKHYK